MSKFFVCCRIIEKYLISFEKFCKFLLKNKYAGWLSVKLHEISPPARRAGGDMLLASGRRGSPTGGLQNWRTTGHLSQSMQMMRDRPFSQEVLRDWNAEESEASEAEEDG